jgi:hypothetical protein
MYLSLNQEYCTLFLYITRGVRASLHAPRLIPESIEHPEHPASLAGM